MKYFAYIRVSTDQQTESGAGLAAQIQSCADYAKKHEAELIDIFRDEGLSGASTLDTRPGMLAAISALSKGDILLVAKRDRIGRDPIVVAMIEAAVSRKGARIVSSSGEGTEYNDPSSILMRRMVDAFSEYERLIIGARTKAALQAKKQKGERVGHIPFGYHLSRDSIHIEANAFEQDILKQMQVLSRSGLSLREIAKELNERGAFNRGTSRWNHSSVQRMLKQAV